METITLKMRFEYYKNLYEQIYNTKITYPEFMECIMSKLEQEIRDKTSKLDGYQILKPKTLKGEDYQYDYDK